MNVFTDQPNYEGGTWDEGHRLEVAKLNVYSTRING